MILFISDGMNTATFSIPNTLGYTRQSLPLANNAITQKTKKTQFKKKKKDQKANQYDDWHKELIFDNQQARTFRRSKATSI